MAFISKIAIQVREKIQNIYPDLEVNIIVFVAKLSIIKLIKTMKNVLLN